MYTIVNDDEVLVGSIVAERYHVRDVIGQGSAGTVFGTEHLAFGRQAAMKVLRPRYASLETIRQTFQAETRVALAVPHPSLCEVFDIGTLPDGAPFYMMERLHGETLAKRLMRDRFSAAAAVDMMMQLLAAMDALHEQQILLRDLRPQNIFLAHRRGCRPIVKVLDIGLSRVMPLDRVQLEWDALRAAAGGRVTNETTGLLSVPYYLSPERIRSEHGLEPTSDIFVAAVILYEVLSGQRPFSGHTWAGLTQRITAAPAPRLEMLRPDLPEDLSELVARCLSANPAVRPPSARALQEELRAAFENPRRGSTSAQVAVAVAPPIEDPGPSTDHDYDDETHTDRNRMHFASFTSGSDRNARPSSSSAIDEASADSPNRTVRPPAVPLGFASTMVSAPDIEVDVEQMPMIEEPAATRRGSELETTLDVAWPGRPVMPATAAATIPVGEELADEETATMQLNPELRAKIEQMTKRTASPTDHASSRPPPTHPIRTPRQR